MCGEQKTTAPAPPPQDGALSLGARMMLFVSPKNETVLLSPFFNFYLLLI